MATENPAIWKSRRRQAFRLERIKGPNKKKRMLQMLIEQQRRDSKTPYAR
jgi:hypothetical protein